MNRHRKWLLTISLIMLVILQGFPQNITLPPGGGNQKASVRALKDIAIKLKSIPEKRMQPANG